MSRAATQLETTIYNEDDTAIHISAMLIPGMRGRREYSAPIEPDDDPEIEIVNVVDEDGWSVSLTDEQEAEAMDQLWNGDES
jgi:hypothetical protein